MSAENQNPGLGDEIGDGISGLLGPAALERLFLAAAGPGAASSGKASFQVGGALSYSHTDHDVKTLITSTADLNSNDDMELTANITEELTLTAASKGEPEQPRSASQNAVPGPKGKTGVATPGSADKSLSTAIIVGNENNAAARHHRGGR